MVYDEIQLECGFRADLLVESQVVVECKAKEKLHPIFHELVLKDGIQRIVNDYCEDS